MLKKKALLALAACLAVQSPLTVLAETDGQENMQYTAEADVTETSQASQPDSGNSSDAGTGAETVSDENEAAGTQEDQITEDTDNNQEPASGSVETEQDSSVNVPETEQVSQNAALTDESETAESDTDEAEAPAEETETEKPETEPEVPDNSAKLDEVTNYRNQWIFVNGEGWYYYNGSGKRATGWLNDGGKWYYLDGENAQYPGVMLKNCDRQIGNQIYAFDNSGVMKTGWYFKFGDGEGWYYFDSNGYVKTGWMWGGDAWYYLGPDNAQYRGLMYRNCDSEIDGEIYAFRDGGQMIKDWNFKFGDGEGWYYYNSSGVRQYGWHFLSGEWYYLSPRDAEYPGLMYRNCDSELDGQTYKFLDSGVMVRGWYWQDGKGWLYYNSSGYMQSGWLKDNGKWYYLDPENENIMVKDTSLEIGGQRYVFKNNGEMLTGWYWQDGEGWLYYQENGYLASGWLWDGTAWYYLDPANHNAMVTDLWKVIDGHWYSFNTNGSMRRNWSFINGNWYYFGGDGAARTGWQTIDGLRYYFYTANDPNGGVECAMAKNTTIDGIAISSDGSASVAYGYAADVLDSVGWNLRAAYNWSASIPWTSTTANASPGSEWFAVYGFKNKTGNCYVMAATFYYMAKLLGYDAHQVTGYVPTVSGGLTPHSWVEIDMNGSTYVFDPDFTNETGRNGYQISYGTSGTWRYANYSRMN